MRHLLTLLLALTLTPAALAEHLPRPDHIVVVIEENRGYSQIMDARNSGSYIHALAKRGMLFTQSYGVTHPSQPNYLALFAGSIFDVTSNACGYSFTTDNLATALLDKGLSFASYAESLPAVGDLSCMSGAYQRKHNPISNWQGTRLPAEMNLRFSDFPQEFSKLPTVSFVIPDQNNDMHDGSFVAADEWLKTRIDPYVEWAFKHNSLLILTWDEDSGKENNQVVTLFVGPMVKAGTNSQRINHYNVLRTMLDMYGLPALGESVDAQVIKGVWKKR
ncbi:MAG: acid phosphatase [Gallionella sp.]|nr:acid phosphatase [Gallionella sp.]